MADELQPIVKGRIPTSNGTALTESHKRSCSMQYMQVSRTERFEELLLEELLLDANSSGEH
jgi:hypothetical protein